MAANTVPIFSNVPKNNWNATNITTANTAKDGTGTVETVFTADATDGSYFRRLIVRPRGTNVATVMRVFMNNGSSNATAANNVLIDEITLPATTNSEVASINGVDKLYDIPMAIGYKINVTIGTTVAGGFSVSGHGGDY